MERISSLGKSIAAHLDKDEIEAIIQRKGPLPPYFRKFLEECPLIGTTAGSTSQP